MGWKMLYIISAIWLLTALAMLIVGFGLRFGWYDVWYVTLHAGEQKRVTNFGTALFCSQVTVTAPSVNDKFSAALLDTYLDQQNGRDLQQFRRPWHVYVEPGDFKTLTFRMSEGALLQLAACSPTLIYLYTFIGNDNDAQNNNDADSRFAVMNLLRQQRLDDTFVYQKPRRIFQPPDEQTLAATADDSVRVGHGGCRAADENHFLREWERLTIESRPSPATVYVILYAPLDSTRDYYNADGIGAAGRRAAHVMLESHLTRAHYDTTHAFHRCDYTHHCAFALSLTAAANERVMVQLMDGYGPSYGYNLNYNYRGSKTSDDRNNNVHTRDGTLRGAEHDDAVFARTLTCRCSTVRWWFYAILFGLVPFIVLSLITAFMLKFRDRTVHAVVNTTNVTTPMKTPRNGVVYHQTGTTAAAANDVVVLHAKPVQKSPEDNVDKNSTTIDDQSSVGVGVTSGDSGVETGGADLSDSGRRPKIPPRPWKSRAGAVRVLPDILSASTNDDEDEEANFLPLTTLKNRIETVVPDEDERPGAAPVPVPKRRSKVGDDITTVTKRLPPPRIAPPALPQRPKKSSETLPPITMSHGNSDVSGDKPKPPNSKFVVNDRRWSTNLHDTSIRLLPADVVNDDENFLDVAPRRRISQDELKAKMAQRKSVAVVGEHFTYGGSSKELTAGGPVGNRRKSTQPQVVLTTEL